KSRRNAITREATCLGNSPVAGRRRSQEGKASSEFREIGRGGSPNRPRTIEVNRPYLLGVTFTTFRQIRIQGAEHMGPLDGSNAFLFLKLFDVSMKFFHLRPMHLGPEMVLGMVAVIEKQPVIDFSVTAHSPGNRFIRICAVMPIVAVE